MAAMSRYQTLALQTEKLISDGLLRFSIGLEHVDDLLAGLEAGLSAC